MAGQAFDIWDSFAQGAQVRAQQEQGRAMAEQRQAIAEQRQAQTAKLQRDAEREAAGTAAFDEFFTEYQPGQPMPTAAVGKMYRTLGPEKTTNIIKGLVDLHQGPDLTNPKGTRDSMLTRLVAIKSSPADRQAAAYGAVTQDYVRRGLMTAEEIPPFSLEQLATFERELKGEPKLTERNPERDLVDPTGKVVVAGVPKAPDAPAVGTLGAAMAAYAGRVKKPVAALTDQEQLGVKARWEAAGRAPTAPPTDNSPLETIIGPDGTAIRVRRADAIGKAPAASTEKASSGVQKRVLNFFNRAQQADGELEGMEANIQQMGLADQGRMQYAPNVMQSQLGQSYNAAQRAFTEARLRKDSGAAIPDQEFANDKRTYFAQPGDSKDTLEQKRRARASILASLAFESGQALGEFVGDGDEAKTIVEKYKARAAGAPSGGGGDTGTVNMTAPDGRALKVPAADVQRMIGLGAKKAGG